MRLALFLLLFLTSCSLPRGGPSKQDLLHQENGVVIRSIRDVDLAYEERRSEREIVLPKESNSYSSNEIYPGDLLAVRVLEVSPLPIFSGKNGGITDLGQLEVEKDGTLYFPYLGAVEVAGLTLAEAQEKLVSGLERKTAGPQVFLRRVGSTQMSVLISGTVKQPGLYPLAPGRDRALQQLSLAGGLLSLPARSEVRLIRDSREVGRWPYPLFTERPETNIPLLPGDQLAVEELPSRFTILGAVGLAGAFKIDRTPYTLLDALADARGFDDRLADPTGVFILRTAPEPEIIHVNMRDLGEIFLAKKFPVRADDTIFVTNASYAAVNKSLAGVNTVINAARLLDKVCHEH